MRKQSIVYVERGPVFRIDGGMVHVEDESGGVLYRRVMSIAQFRIAITQAQAILAEHDHGRVVPFRKRRAQKDAS